MLYMYKTNYHFSFTIGSCACCWCVHRRLDGTALIAEIIFIFAISLGVASITVWACRINLQLSFLYTTVHSGIMQISDLPVLLINLTVYSLKAMLILHCIGTMQRFTDTMGRFIGTIVPLRTG